MSPMFIIFFELEQGFSVTAFVGGEPVSFQMFSYCTSCCWHGGYEQEIMQKVTFLEVAVELAGVKDW